jgi:hypothetical protein
LSAAEQRAKRTSITAARASFAAAAAAIWLMTGVTDAQTGADAAYTASIEALCRGYAGTQVGLPADFAFRQCMSERHCRVLPGAGYVCAMPGPMSWHGGGY